VLLWYKFFSFDVKISNIIKIKYRYCRLLQAILSVGLQEQRQIASKDLLCKIVLPSTEVAKHLDIRR
jgi:hypothetical protein